MTNSAFGFWLFALRVGWKALRSSRWRFGLRCFLLGLQYSRVPSFPALVEFLGYATGKRILDIGSPKLASLYLVMKCGATVYATDLRDPEIVEWKKCAAGMGDTASNYIVEYQDARHLTYPEDVFDAVYSISVLEHIPENGDSQAMREIARVLKPGGRAFVQVPFRPSYEEVCVARDVYGRKYDGIATVFFERRYDMTALFIRIIHASPLRLTGLFYHRERWPFLTYWHRLPVYCRVPLMWLEPLFGMLFLTRTMQASAPYVRGAYLIFEKSKQ